MAQNVRRFRCNPDAVFRILGDGWLYPGWVVGASRMRAVDDAWPGPDARLHHSVGVWPALIDDSTSCVTWDPPRRMELRARSWPIGEAHVRIDVKPHADGSLVRIRENPVSGPAKYLPSMLVDVLLRRRNAETLHRLAYLAEGIGPNGSDPTAHRESGAVSS
ncbi:SRPBCC family protein [Paramicrobacterium agarici]|uniref:SRPBCC family protein n=1 Tax=Paramicrobacterium agarici TaxID=630514 RepID=UPI001154D903|nr:SRPBCC family protein [Microbacterium agarici]TQO22459.1 polyketide cyclase/dehydrase/lipid transport protein [Microbacterium agarici]